MRTVFIAILVIVFSLNLHAADPQEMPTVKKQVTPVYPEQLKKTGVEGSVWLKATVDETGKVSEVSVEKATNKDFVSAATDAVKQWEFNPGTKNGKPIKVVVVIPFSFKLDKRSEGSEKEELKNIEEKIKDLVRGIIPEPVKNYITADAHIVLADRDELLSSVLSEQSKRKLIVEGSDVKIETTRMVLNEAKDGAFLVLKTHSPKSKSSRYHTIVLTKTTDGVWKIQAWHMSA